jgi:hypothetical protein
MVAWTFVYSGLGLSIVWPAHRPFVTIRGCDCYRRIPVWRVPAYLDRRGWWIQWQPSDGPTVRAYPYDPSLK